MTTESLPVFVSLIAGLPFFLLHLSTATLVWFVGLVIYSWITPHHELRLIKAGNQAAAVSMGGAAIGLALPMAFTLASSAGVWDILVWGTVALVVQLLAFSIIGLLLRNLSSRIEAGEMAAAIFLAMTKIALAALNSAALAG